MYACVFFASRLGLHLFHLLVFVLGWVISLSQLTLAGPPQSQFWTWFGAWGQQWVGFPVAPSGIPFTLFSFPFCSVLGTFSLVHFKTSHCPREHLCWGHSSAKYCTGSPSLCWPLASSRACGVPPRCRSP